MSFQGTIDQYIALGAMFWFALRYVTSPSIGDGGLIRSILQDFLTTWSAIFIGVWSIFVLTWFVPIVFFIVLSLFNSRKNWNTRMKMKDDQYDAYLTGEINKQNFYSIAVITSSIYLLFTFLNN
jgi:hypothetical protein